MRSVLLRSAAVAVPVAGVCVASTSPGFRRTCEFWSTLAPFLVEFQAIKARARLEGCEKTVLEARLRAFHERTAANAVQVILSLGGIYVKLGQLVSTIGAGVFEDAYISALRPLQDGVPPRPYDDIARIIERSVGAPMSDLFESFEPRPLGSASIAQAHRATLRGGERVVVKVQYPEVAELFEADFDNLEFLTAMLFPENGPLVKGLRRRHIGELDFRTEAAHLRECRENAMARGVEPSLVRIPAVPRESLCTRHVLAMEMLEGVSLASAIEAETAELAALIGLSSGELRARVMGRMRKHFDGGGGPLGEEDGGAVELARAVDLALAGARLLRGVAAARRRCRRALDRLHNAWAALVGVLTRGRIRPQLRLAPRSAAPSELGRAVKQLIHFHGCQLLLDGVYNCDPHPGNVLLLPDGRLGLIDYGMVGRIGAEERQKIARVLRALAAGDVQTTARLYEENGYRASWHSGTPHTRDVVHRIATFHLDRIDLSPVDAGGGRMMPIQRVLQQTFEHAVPDWIEQSRRLGGLLIGVASQCGRPISLAHEWGDIAEGVLRDRGED